MLTKPQPRIVIFTGSGISAESGLATFRGDDGLWNNHAIDDVCNENTWRQNYGLVHDFYNNLRQSLAQAKPNQAHYCIAQIQQQYGTLVQLVTQNVDDLLERAGATKVLHLHGHLCELRCDHCAHEWGFGYQLFDQDNAEHRRCPHCGEDQQCVRPNIVFFGGPAPNYHHFYRILAAANHPDSIFIVSGTQGSVVPIDSLLQPVKGRLWLNNLEQSPYIDSSRYERVWQAPATQAWPEIMAQLENHCSALGIAP